MSNIYDISKIENYNESFSLLSIHDTIELFEKYICLVNEYIDIFFKDVNIENINYLLYVFFKGLTMIEHVYTILLLYSKNSILSYHHTQKSIYYYIEFISRLPSNRDTYLKITPTDAVLFVYKKTIHNLNTEIYHNIRKEEIIHFKECIYCYTYLIVTIFNRVLDKKETIKDVDKITEFLKDSYHNALDKMISKDINIHNDFVYSYFLDYYSKMRYNLISKKLNDGENDINTLYILLK